MRDLYLPLQIDMRALCWTYMAIRKVKIKIAAFHPNSAAFHLNSAAFPLKMEHFSIWYIKISKWESLYLPLQINMRALCWTYMAIRKVKIKIAAFHQNSAAFLINSATFPLKMEHFSIWYIKISKWETSIYLYK